MRKHNESFTKRIQTITREGEAGQSLVIISLSMLILIGMLGLAVDIGYGFALYRQMQTAADMAALAGTRELALGHGEVAALSRMEEMLRNNGADPELSEYEIVGSGEQTQVVARTQFVPIFTPLFGVDNIPIGRNADAVFGQLSQVGDIMPFGVREDLWQLGAEVNIWSGETGEGNYGWVRWTGQSQGLTILRMNIDDPSNSDTLTVGDYVMAKTGVSFSSVRPSLQAKIGQTVTVFFYDPDQVVGTGINQRYRVTGFGRFTISGIESRGVNSEIRGHFVETVQMNGIIIPGRNIGMLGTGLTK
jgi:hypothetical protein